MSIRLKAAAGKSNVKALVMLGEFVWNGSDLVALSTLNLTQWRAALIACTELKTATPEGMGVYVATWPATLSEAAAYTVLFWEGATPNPSDRSIGKQEDPTEYIPGQVVDIYHAAIELTIDEDNTRDEYTVAWFKNAVRITSGITSPTITVTNRADGSDLIATTPMTAIGSTGGLKYNEGTNRTTEGEAVDVTVSATIDGSPRPWSDLVSRDA